MTSQIPPVPPMTLDDWQKWGRYSFRRVDDILRTHEIPKGGAGTTADLVEDKDDSLDQIEVTLDDGDVYTVREIVDATDTDGWLVLRDDKVVFEEYPGDEKYPTEYPGKMPEGTRHLLMSVTKSLTATIAGILEDKGLINPENDKVADHVRDLNGCEYGEATVRDVLDMRSAIEFSEAYHIPTSEVRQLEAASGWATPETNAPDNVKTFLAERTNGQGRKHGERFEYRSCETAVLGWVCEEAYAKRHGATPFKDMVSELLWSKLGVESDAYITVDKNNTASFDGGMCATLRDLARFGSMICRGGKSLSNERVVSPTWVKDIFENGTPFERNPSKYPEKGMPGGKFRSMFWSPTDDHKVVLCIGVHGQMVYINRDTQTVGVKLSSWQNAEEDWPGNVWKGMSAFRMFDKISTELK